MQEKPQIEAGSVARALKAMRDARPLGFAHPLTTFISLRTDQAVVGADAADTAIFHALSNRIRRRLDQHRRLHNLPPTTLNDNGAAMRVDFQAGNEALEAWSVLYYGYVRVDLDLSIKKMSKLAQQSERTLERRHYTGVRRLTSDLILREMHTRRKQRNLTLRSRLPSAFPRKLIGREALIETALRRLIGPEPPHHLLIHGARGIGKTALALTLAHRLIEQGQIHNLVWVENPDPNPDRLVETIRLQLAFSPESELSLRQYLQMVDTLIVLDHVPDNCTLLLEMLSPARLIVCMTTPPSKESEGEPLHIAYLEVHELDQESSLALLEWETEALHLGRQAVNRPNVDMFNKIFEDLGGNPRALRMAAAAGRRYKPVKISARLYQRVWNSLAAPARLLWLALAFYPYPANEQMLGALLGVSRAKPALELERISVTVDNTLTSLARRFAESKLNDRHIRGLAQSAAQRVAGWLLNGEGKDNLAASLYLLAKVQRTDLSVGLLLKLAYNFCARIEGAGAWLAWSEYLEPLYHRLSSKSLADRLWVGTRLGVAYRRLARWEEAIYSLTDVIEHANTGGLLEAQAEAMLELGIIYRYRNEYPTSGQLLQRAAEFYQEANLPLSYERALAAQIQVALDANDLESAQKLLTRTPAAPSAPLSMLAAQVTLRCARQDADLSEALRYAEAARYALDGDWSGLARLASLIAQIYYRLGHWKQATDNMTWATDTLAVLNDPLGYARARLNLAAMYIGQGKVEAAARHLEGLPAEFERLGDLNSLNATLRNLELIQRLART